MQIILKILLYGAIIFFATVITDVVRVKNMTSDIREAGEYCANFKNYSKVFYILGIIMTAIMLLVSLFPSNVDVLSQVIISLALTVPFYLAGYFVGRCYIKLGVTEIKYRRCFGKEKIISYNEITKAVINDAYTIELYSEDKKLLDYPKEFNTFIFQNILKEKNIKVGYLNTIKEFVMEPMKINFIGLYMCVGIGAAFIVFCFIVNHIGGILWGIILMVWGLFFANCYKKDKLVVSNNKITRCKFLKKPRTFNFSDVKSVKIMAGESKKILIYSDVEKKIIIPGHFTNYQLFEELIKKQHWKVQK